MTGGFRDRMQAGEAAAAQHRWPQAYQHYSAAHDLGHGVRMQHLAAHRGALSAAWRMRHAGRTVYQAVFLCFAFLTSHG